MFFLVLAISFCLKNLAFPQKQWLCPLHFSRGLQPSQPAGSYTYVGVTTYYNHDVIDVVCNRVQPHGCIQSFVTLSPATRVHTGWAKKVSLIIFVITLSAANQFS